MLWWPLTTITSWMLDQQSSPCVENTLPSYGSLPFTPDIVYGCWSPSSRGLERRLRSCSVSPVAEIGRIMAVNKSPVKVPPFGLIVVAVGRASQTLSLAVECIGVTSGSICRPWTGQDEAPVDIADSTEGVKRR
nr:uncharacterized protein LOC113823669 [Penaeus vannamei]XP_027232149.1 uncharacterized protein LOC113823669 [Penaeus vannamei]XP_027232150.1 uncharacterized protein LOC113823669 [Penaeus vannamei]